jgi:hypothetical protein
MKEAANEQPRVNEGQAREGQGAILSDDQIKRLKVAITVMSALLVIGIITLIARVVYLASGRSEQAPSTAMVAAPANAPQVAPLLADVKLALPAGATLKSTSLQGQRLLAHYSGPRGDGLIILDLTNGKTVSHVRVEAQP